MVGDDLEYVEQVVGRLNYDAARRRLGRPDRRADARAAGRSPRFHSVSGLRPDYSHVVADVEVADFALQVLTSGNRRE
jgi:hypothetical protein